MNSTWMAGNEKRFRVALWMLFGCLFLYLTLRAWFVEPLKDELLTYFFFVEPNKILDKEIIGDEANNHLLNSFAAWFLNKFDNGNFFLMRLPNLLAFPFFFWGIVKLVQGSGKPWQQFVVVLATVCVPFYLEYFAACRGYGIALACLVWLLYHTKAFAVDLGLKQFLFAWFAAWVMVFANLGYIMLAFIALGVIVFVQCVHFRSLTLRKHLWLLLIAVGFGVSLLPFVNLANELREAGALYYGSMDGFWLVTAKSVLRYTIFYEGEWLKYLLGVGFSIIITVSIVSLFRKGLAGFMRLPETIYSFFLAGSVAGIFFLAKVKQVNYPEDRVAMYLVLLTLLMTGTLLLRTRFAPFSLLLLGFPIVFFAKMNLDSSVISPDDRMNAALYRTSLNYLDSSSTVAGYHTLPLMWTWNQRMHGKNQLEMQATGVFYPYFDYIFTRADLPAKPDSVTNYQLIASHARSMFKVWKRTNRITKKLVIDTVPLSKPSTGEYLNLAYIPVTDNMRSKPFYLSIQAELRPTLPYGDVFLVYGTVTGDGSPGRYEQFNLLYAHGLSKTAIPIRQNFILQPFTKGEKELRVYIWNRQRTNMYFYNGRVKLYEIEP